MNPGSFYNSEWSPFALSSRRYFILQSFSSSVPVNLGGSHGRMLFVYLAYQR
uniref:Uncharacterized protein n=1 Tax=Anguilla anguilla TaxID=7936 RepID=A0A0E9PWB1_ANGAN